MFLWADLITTGGNALDTAGVTAMTGKPIQNGKYLVF